MERISNRDYPVLLAWLDYVDFNRPSRTDYYLMQVAAEIARKFNKNAKSIRTQQYKLKFDKKKPVPKLTKEEQAAEHRKLWLSRLTRKKPNG